MDDDHSKEFHDLVNMTPAALEKFLETPESKEVGQKKSEGAESAGHQSGRKIVEILRKKKADLTEADQKQMGRTVAYIKRHLAQKPDGDISDTPWRYSLMNWGHDPSKKK